jgi:hypothetical protein
MLKLAILVCTILTSHRSAGSPRLASTTLQSKPTVDGEALSIGRVTLRLGMPKDAALSDLGKYYFLQRYEPSTESFDNWMILNKVKHEENLGALRFRLGKLTLARKEWTHEEKVYSGTDTIEIIYKLTSEFESKGNVNCTIRTYSSVQQTGPGGVEFRETEITCGHRQIELMLSWQSGPAWVQVSESIVDEAEMIP